MLQMQRFTQKICARFYAFTLSGLVNKSLVIFILVLLEGFSFLLSYYLLFTVFLFCFCKPLIREGFELPVSHVAAMGSGSSGS